MALGTGLLILAQQILVDHLDAAWGVKTKTERSTHVMANLRLQDESAKLRIFRGADRDD